MSIGRRWQGLILMLLIAASCIALTVVTRRATYGDNDRQLVAGWMQLRRFFRGTPHAPTELGKNHELVKAAFREVIAEANEATVRVFSNMRQVALGTVVSANGLVLTKSSELTGKIEVAVEHQGRFEAKVLQRWRDLDLALLQVEGAPALAAISLEELPDEPAAGAWVAVPGGRSELPIAVGVVSSPVRSISSDMALLGILMENASGGVRVRSVVDGSSAARSGITAGDIVTQVGGQEISSSDELQFVIRGYSAGDQVELSVRRPSADETLVIHTTLGSITAGPNGEEEHTGGRLNDRRSGFAKVVQHDCPLQANQCGGPLVDSRGRVIGINIAKAGRVEIYALPISIIRQNLGSLAQRTGVGDLFLG